MGKKVEIGETIVKVITQVEFDELKMVEVETSNKRLVKCQRCGSVLFNGTIDELAVMVTEWARSAKEEDENLYGVVEFKCQNEEFEDPRKPRPTTIVNKDGEKELVAVERLKGCSQVVTMSILKP